jgi:hypothetical protein
MSAEWASGRYRMTRRVRIRIDLMFFMVLVVLNWG